MSQSFRTYSAPYAIGQVQTIAKQKRLAALAEAKSKEFDVNENKSKQNTQQNDDIYSSITTTNAHGENPITVTTSNEMNDIYNFTRQMRNQSAQNVALESQATQTMQQTLQTVANENVSNAKSKQRKSDRSKRNKKKSKQRNVNNSNNNANNNNNNGSNSNNINNNNNSSNNNIDNNAISQVLNSMGSLHIGMANLNQLQPDLSTSNSMGGNNYTNFGMISDPLNQEKSLEMNSEANQSAPFLENLNPLAAQQSSQSQMSVTSLPDLNVVMFCFVLFCFVLECVANELLFF